MNWELDELPEREVSLDDWIIVIRSRLGNPEKLLHDPDFLELSLASRGLLLTIWLLGEAEGSSLQIRNLARVRPCGLLPDCTLKSARWVLASRGTGGGVAAMRV
jgi:hypothetical protein